MSKTKRSQNPLQPLRRNWGQGNSGCVARCTHRASCLEAGRADHHPRRYFRIRRRGRRCDPSARAGDCAGRDHGIYPRACQLCAFPGLVDAHRGGDVPGGRGPADHPADCPHVQDDRHRYLGDAGLYRHGAAGEYHGLFLCNQGIRHTYRRMARSINR